MKDTVGGGVRRLPFDYQGAQVAGEVRRRTLDEEDIAVVWEFLELRHVKLGIRVKEDELRIGVSGDLIGELAVHGRTGQEDEIELIELLPNGPRQLVLVWGDDECLRGHSVSTFGLEKGIRVRGVDVVAPDGSPRQDERDLRRRISRRRSLACAPCEDRRCTEHSRESDEGSDHRVPSSDVSTAETSQRGARFRLK